MKDFVPMPTADGYEGYEALTERCSNWMRSQPEARVINFQSVLIRKTDGGGHLFTYLFTYSFTCFIYLLAYLLILFALIT